MAEEPCFDEWAQYDEENNGENNDDEEFEEDEAELLVIDEGYQEQEYDSENDRISLDGGVRPYKHAQTKAVYSIRGTSLTFAQAKLFGLVDENGQIKVPKVESDHQHDMKGLEFVRKLNKKSKCDL